MQVKRRLAYLTLISTIHSWAFRKHYKILQERHDADLAPIQK